MLPMIPFASIIRRAGLIGSVGSAVGLSAQSSDAQLCDRLAVTATREASRAIADRTIRAGGPTADFLRGCLVWDETRPDASLRYFEAATKQPGATADHWLWLGNAYGVKAQRANPVSKALLARKVKSAFERAVQVDGANVQAREGLMQFYLQAPSVMGGSLDKASEQALAIAAVNGYRGGLASMTVAVRRKDDGAAERAAQALRSVYPDSVQVVSAMATYFAQRRRFPELWTLLEGASRSRVLAAHPRLQFLIGRAAALSGQHTERGVAALKAYIDGGQPAAGEPRLAAARWRLGQLYERQGKPDTAAAEYQAALAEDPDNSDIRKALQKVRAPAK